MTDEKFTLPRAGLVDELMRTIHAGFCEKVENKTNNTRVKAYRIRSSNPKVYTLRVDVRIEEE